VNEYLVNETMAHLGFRRQQDALGQSVESGNYGPTGAKGTIVGVVRDFHQNSLHAAITPLYIDYNKQVSAMSIRLALEALQPAGVAKVLSQMERIWKATYPHEKFSQAFFDETIANLYQQE
jgi:putative ABC transport system permease protein